jgi:FkbM family methyltransferase
MQSADNVVVADTRRLFLRLLRTFEIGTVCDVGSMDGSDALRFRRMLPRAKIIALEPNPRNFELMEADSRLQREHIRVLPLAASDRDANAQFFVVRAEHSPSGNPALRGMSSLHRRTDGSPLAEVVGVHTIRLDSLLAAGGDAGGHIAFWIDTEGMAFETISGASGVLARTQMLHVEVETVPCIGAEQRLLADVERILTDAGFRLVATDEPKTSIQFNALFVRADLPAAKAALMRWHLGNVRLRRHVVRAMLPLLPMRLRRFLYRHVDAVPA